MSKKASSRINLILVSSILVFLLVLGWRALLTGSDDSEQVPPLFSSGINYLDEFEDLSSCTIFVINDICMSCEDIVVIQNAMEAVNEDTAFLFAPTFSLRDVELFRGLIGQEIVFRISRGENAENWLQGLSSYESIRLVGNYVVRFKRNKIVNIYKL